jgi:hypothetical protein
MDYKTISLLLIAAAIGYSIYTGNAIPLAIILVSVLTVYTIYDRLIVNGQKVIFEQVESGKESKTIDSSLFKLNHHYNGVTFTNTFWLYIQDLNYNFMNEKMIYEKDKMRVYLAKVSNDIIIEMPIYDSKTVEKIIVKNVPIQKWVQIAIIIENRNVDVWVNDVLYSSKLLSNMPKIDDSLPLYVNRNGGFGGYISKFYFYDKPLSKRFIQFMFSFGPIIGAPFEIIRKLWYYIRGYPINFTLNASIQVSNNDSTQTNSS